MVGKEPDMSAFARFRPSPALVVALLALLVALGDTGWATISQSLPRGSVGTAQIKTNAVTAKDIRSGAVRSAEIRNGSIGLRDLGPRARGRRGPAGPAGPAGAPGAVSRLWAVVNASGSIARGVGTTAVGRTSLGSYEIIFGQNVANCVFMASIGESGNISPTDGMVTVGRRAGNLNGVRVNTRNQNGMAADRGFHLIVVC
jgi:hypothetical protein